MDTQDGFCWSFDREAAASPLPLSESGRPDLLSVTEDRYVTAGQVLAALAPDATSEPHTDGPITAGAGVWFQPDRRRYVAAATGIVVVKERTLSVLPVTRIVDNLTNEKLEFSGSVVIEGAVTASTIQAEGTVALRGTIAGCTIRARGDALLGRCARSRIVADGDIVVREKLLHSHTVTPRRLLSKQGSTLAGGTHFALGGARVWSAGGADRTATLLAADVDRFTPLRQDEVEREIRRHSDSIERIGSALRPLGAPSHDVVSAEKRELIKTLWEQRNRLEQRVRELTLERRNLLTAPRAGGNAEIIIEGTIFPGVTVQIEGASITAEETGSAVRFRLTSFRDSVSARPLNAAAA